MNQLSRWILEQEKHGQSENAIRAFLQQHDYSPVDIDKAYVKTKKFKQGEKRVKKFSSTVGIIAVFLIIYGLLGFIIGVGGLFYTNLSLFDEITLNTGPVASTLTSLTSSLQVMSTTTKGLTQVIQQTQEISTGTAAFATSLQATLDELLIPQFSLLGADVSS